MKAIVNRTEFLRAFELCADVAPSNPPRTVMGSVLMDVGDDGCVLAANDGQTSIRVRVYNVDVGAKGRAMLPRDRVRSVLSLLPIDTLGIFSDESGLRIVANENGWWQLVTPDPAEFPKDIDVIDGVTHVLSASALSDLIRLTIIATDPKSTRWATGGVMVESGSESGSDPSITFVGTDGRRAAIATVACDVIGPSAAKARRGVIPARSMKFMLECLEHDDTPVSLTIGRRSMKLETPRITLSSSLLEGLFPDHTKVNLGKPTTSVHLDSGVFFRALDQAATMADSPNSRSVLFRVLPSEMRLIAGDDAIGHGSVSIPIDGNVKPIDIYINPVYVRQALGVIGKDVDVSLELSKDTMPAVVRVRGRGYTYVVMPMTGKEKTA